jgi:hypothetical protein
MLVCNLQNILLLDAWVGGHQGVVRVHRHVLEALDGLLHSRLLLVVVHELEGRLDVLMPLRVLDVLGHFVQFIHVQVGN